MLLRLRATNRPEVSAGKDGVADALVPPVIGSTVGSEVFEYLIPPGFQLRAVATSGSGCDTVLNCARAHCPPPPGTVLRLDSYAPVEMYRDELIADRMLPVRGREMSCSDVHVVVTEPPGNALARIEIEPKIEGAREGEYRVTLPGPMSQESNARDARVCVSLDEGVEELPARDVSWTARVTVTSFCREPSKCSQRVKTDLRFVPVEP